MINDVKIYKSVLPSRLIWVPGTWSTRCECFAKFHGRLSCCYTEHRNILALKDNTRCALSGGHTGTSIFGAVVCGFVKSEVPVQCCYTVDSVIMAWWFDYGLI